MFALAFTAQTGALIALAFVALAIVHRAVAKKHWSQERDLRKMDRLILMSLGWAACTLVSVLCLLYSEQPAAIVTPPVPFETRGASFYALAAPAYWAWMEEISFRGYLQFQISNILGKWSGALVSALLFMLIHVWNPGFQDMWPQVVIVSLTCVLLTVRSGTMFDAVSVHVLFNLTGVLLAVGMNGRPFQSTSIVNKWGVSAIAVGCIGAFLFTIGRQIFPRHK